MMHKIKAVRTMENFIIEATFFDGTIKQYDIKNMFAVYPPMKELENVDLFNSAQVDAGGYGISWNDDLDLEAETIWEEGMEIGKDTNNPILELAAMITEARERAGITQKQLAERTGIYQADISKIERGIGNPSVNTLQRIAEGIGVRLKIGFM